jgi:folate-binding protein YgfZ
LKRKPLSVRAFRRKGREGTAFEVGRAVMGAAFADGAARSRVFALMGEDRAKYLHGQCTQDVKGTPLGSGGAAWMLDARGTNLGPLRFTVLPDHLQCATEPALAAATVARLDKFVITADVRIRLPDPPVPVLRLFGPQSEAALVAALGADAAPAADPESNAACDAFDAHWIVVRQNDAGPGFEIRLFAAPEAAHAAAESLVAALERAGAAPIGEDAYEAVRVLRGTPRFGVDVSSEHLPAESGTLAATVSFTKGCYAGQEVVAKQQYLGRPRKVVVRLRRASGASAPTAVGTKVSRQDGAEAGAISSCVAAPDGGAVAFATLKPDAAAPETALVDADGARWTVEG